MHERADVVIVGARCAGSAAAIALARRGRSVIAVDSASFPSDTLSTHLFFPNHWAELELLGARERVDALGAPLHTKAGLGTPELEIVGPFAPYGGIAAGACVRRPGLDHALVETAREAGAEVRERVRVTGLLHSETGRVVGVQTTDRGGDQSQISAKLVVGADGRHSTVARLAGARTHHLWENQRMMAFAYYDDPREDLRNTAMQWRVGDELVTVFPCDGGQSVILLMPPVKRADEFRHDALVAFEGTVERVAPLRQRLTGCARVTKVRVSYRHPSFFRHSHGPGWVLAGDAGHYKDPVTAQGIRDALRFGRLMGEAAAPHLDDPPMLDRALATWEADRDAECLPMYQWANLLGRDDAISPLEMAAYRWFANRPAGATEVLDLFSRRRLPKEVFSPDRVIRWIAAALCDPSTPRSDVWRTVRRDLRRELDRVVEERMFVRRRARSEHALPLLPDASGDESSLSAEAATP